MILIPVAKVEHMKQFLNRTKHKEAKLHWDPSLKYGD